MRLFACIALFAAGCFVDPMARPPSSGGGLPGRAVPLPGGTNGIAFDDLRVADALGRVVVPARTTGNLDFVDLASFEVASIPGFGDAGSADAGGGFVFVVDRAGRRIVVADPAALAIVATAPVAAAPDYVRFVAPTNEVWVTEPGAERIEVFALAPGAAQPTFAAFIATPGGPEGLAVDATRKRAYVHLDAGAIAAIDLAARAVVATWPTGCQGSHGIPAVDEPRGFVLAGCSESARVAVLDAARDGAVRDSFTLGGGQTLLAYSPALHHVYLRGDPGLPVATLALSATGQLSQLGSVTAAMTGHCVAADGQGGYWVCDAAGGRLLRFADPYPATP